MSKIIASFTEEYDFLSNFYPCEVRDRIYGITFPSAEHFYQSRKTTDMNKKIEISKMTAGQAKRFGQKISLPRNWDVERVFQMTVALYSKFSTDEMKQKLLSTKGAIIIEGNHWHDKYWGKCYCMNCRGEGLNMLGKMLMYLRYEFEKPSPVFIPFNFLDKQTEY